MLEELEKKYEENYFFDKRELGKVKTV